MHSSFPFSFWKISLPLTAWWLSSLSLSKADEWLHLDTAPAVSAEVCAPFIYDPLTQQSQPNQHSMSCLRESKSLPMQTKLAAGKSFTIEAIVKPMGAAETPMVRQTRRSEAASEAGLMMDYFPQHNQFYLKGFITPPRAGMVKINAGYYGSTAQYQGEKDVAWRHLALVYDAEKRTATTYIDYYLSGTEPMPQELLFDDGSLEIGGGKFSGLVDEVRVTAQALRPAQFLRGRAVALAGVSFESNQRIVPNDAGCLDVKQHFGAVGDGQTDDTAAFNTAFATLCSRVPLAYHTLLVPAGTYLITDMIQGGRFIDVKGAGPEKTVLKLKDGVFTDPQHPKPILRLSSSHEAPGSYHGVNGSSISIYLEGMTFDTGRGNPGARGLEYHANNIGRLENVVIRSGDGAGVCGLDLTHHDCGPALVKHLRVEGFDYGIHSNHQEYSMTFEHISLQGQKVTGLLNQGNIVAVRGLISKNAVPAIISDGPNSMVTLLDSSLTGGAVDAPAIKAEGALYALRVQTAGYGKAVAKRILISQKTNEWSAETTAGPALVEYVGDHLVPGFGAAQGALKLPIEETPEPPNVPVNEWVNVAKFAEHGVGKDWSPAVEAAMASGARVIYFPRDLRMEFATPIHVHGRVERFVGFGGELHWSSQVWQEKPQREQTDAASAPPPLLIYDEPNAAHVFTLDRLACVHVQHASAATLVLRSSSPGRYSTKRAGGKLFAEDVGGADWHFDHPQHVWVRQWNPESHETGPCVHSQGATIWALGFKTEYSSQKFLAEAGAQTEILGSFIYPIGKIPEDRPIFENRNSRIALIYGTSVYQANHKVHIIDTQGNATKTIGNDALHWAGSRGRMDLYVSEPP